MRIRKRLVLAVMMWCSIPAEAADLKYDSPVSLEGMLISAVADPSITSDEKPHQFPALKLNAPVNVVCDPGDHECRPENGVSLLHLVLKNDQIEFFKSRKGHGVTLTGELFHSDNGNQFTSVLIDVKSIK